VAVVAVGVAVVAWPHLAGPHLAGPHLAGRRVPAHPALWARVVVVLQSPRLVVGPAHCQRGPLVGSPHQLAAQTAAWRSHLS
jgi:hypothetical protein